MDGMRNTTDIFPEFRELLHRWEAGDIEPDELARLQNMMSHLGESEQVRKGMLDELMISSEEPVSDRSRYDEMFGRIKQSIDQLKEDARNKMELKYVLMKIAAVVVFAFLLGGSASFFILKSNLFEPKEMFCEVVAPRGSTSQILLPDNSSVWLNAGSKIRYSSAFNKTNRFLKLEGEGYFKVAKNKEIPFVVDAFGFEVKAVGTEFNVKAYKEETTIETTMVEGRVSLHHSTENIMNGVYLEPNQKATFFKREKDITVEVLKKIEEKKELNYLPEHRLIIAPRVDPSAQVSWKEKRLIIAREQLGPLAEILSRKYDFKFEFKSEDVKHYVFNGTLEDETLQQVMDAIKLSSPIDYKIVGKTVFIDWDVSRAKSFQKLFKD